VPARNASVRAQVRAALAECTIRDEYPTAIQVKRMLPDVSLATVSSILCKMAKAGQISRTKGVGPRGGYGYRALSLYDLQVALARKAAEEWNRRAIKEMFESP
jgi:hypothetical protein